MVTPSRAMVSPSWRRGSAGLPMLASLALAAGPTLVQSTARPAPYTVLASQSPRASAGLMLQVQVAGLARRWLPDPPAVLSSRGSYTRRPRTWAPKLSCPSNRAAGNATTL